MLKRCVLLLFLASNAFALNPPQPPTAVSQDNRVNLNDAFEQAQPKKFRIANTTPTLRDIREQELVVVDTGTVTLVFRRNNNLYYLPFSLNPVQYSIIGSINAPKVLVNFDGTSGAINGTSVGVTSITHVTTGVWYVNFSTPMADTNYMPICTSNFHTSIGATTCNYDQNFVKYTQIHVRDVSASDYDNPSISLAIFSAK